MNNELMVLLGCGLAAYAVTNACTSIYEKAEESDSEDEYEGFSCGGYHQEEGYGGCGGSGAVPEENFVYTTPNQKCPWESQIKNAKTQKDFNSMFTAAERPRRNFGW